MVVSIHQRKPWVGERTRFFREACIVPKHIPKTYSYKCIAATQEMYSIIHSLDLIDILMEKAGICSL